MKRFLISCLSFVLAVGLVPAPALGVEAAQAAGRGGVASVKAIASSPNAGRVASTATKKVKGAAAMLYAGSATKGAKALKAKGLSASKAKWKSSKPKVASVSRAGKVTAKKAGKATVTAKQGKTTYTFAITVKNVTINKSKATVNAGKTFTLKLTGDKIKSARTSNKKVATVTAAGIVKGVAGGTATITIVSKKGKKFTCKVTVAVPVTGVAFTRANLVLMVGGDAFVNTAAVKPSTSSNKTVTYATSNGEVATVSESGAVTPKAVGTATITATSSNGKRATCAVRVCEAADYPEAAADACVANVNADVRNNSRYSRNGTVDVAHLSASFGSPRPQLGWVHLEDGTVSEYEFYFDDEYVLKTKNQRLVKGYDPATLVNVKDYGAVGDGKADDDAAVKRAVTDVNAKGGILYFPLGTYRVAISTGNGDGAITVKSQKHVELDFGKSTLELQANGYQAYSMVRAVNCADVEVRNGTFVGDRLEHDYETLYSGTHEWGMGVHSGNNVKCSILNMDISNMTGDAIYCKNSGTGTTDISDCSFHHCRRQGISIVSADVLNVRDTDIHHIGCPDETDTPERVRSTKPAAGIDIEPNGSDDLVKYVLFDNVTSRDNVNCGLVEETRSELVSSVEVVGCHLEKVSVSKNVVIRDSELVYPPEAGDDTTDELKRCTLVGTHVIGVGKGNLRLKNSTADKCVFEGEDVGDSGALSFRFIPVNSVVTNSTFKNVQGKGKAKWSTGSITDYGIPLADHPTRGTYNLAEGSGNNTYEGCGVIIDNLVETGSTFKDCYISKGSNGKSPTVSGGTFENCTINVRSNTARFSDCELSNCSFLAGRSAVTYLSDSTLTCAGIAEKGYFPGAFTCDASTVQVAGEVAGTAFSNVTFLNRSRIVLDNYASIQLDVPKSTEEVDYVIECRGDNGTSSHVPQQAIETASHRAFSERGGIRAAGGV